ncbi:MAG: sensor histidine kinase [Ramlibacter sp.]
MRLSEFLKSQSGQILAAWDEFAGTVTHTGASLDQKGLRDHAAQILSTIAADLDQPQSDAQQVAKSRGEAERNPTVGDSAAETHADTRIDAGFAIDAMITEYRALRASVLRLWQAKTVDSVQVDELTQLTRFNEAIDQAIAESVARYMRQVNHSNNLLMGVLGHDIRNPLGTIRLSVEVLTRTGQLTAKAAAPIVNSAKRIESIIELIVDFSRAQAETVMATRMKAGNLQAMFESVINETRVRHAEARIELVSSGDFSGVWDEGRMGQLLSNLLENALVYGERGQPVTVNMTSDGATSQVAVHNHGRAIPLQERERIFEPRSRGSAQDEKRAPGGLGLGLYICREIVRAHHGTLSLRSDDEAGTTFVISLPNAPP